MLSAHRTPKETVEYAEFLTGREIKVVSCGAGGSAALSGVVAAHTTLPVIGVPLDFHGFWRSGRAAFHCADAAGCSGRQCRHRKGGCQECRASGRTHPRFVSDETLVQKLDDYTREQAEKILRG